MTDFKALYDEHPEYVRRRDADSYEAKRTDIEVKAYKIPNFVAILPDRIEYSTVAEIGCATGEIIANFPGAEITRRVGFDISPENIAAARRRFPHTTFDARDFRETNEIFDVVILSDVLEHVEDDVGFLADAARIGRIVLVNLPIEKVLVNIGRKYGPDDPSGHLRWYSFNEGLELVHRAGLEVIKWRKAWFPESPGEPMRQELNRTVFGHRFRGSTPVRWLKGGVSYGCRSAPLMGRLVYPGNLFVSAFGKAFD